MWRGRERVGGCVCVWVGSEGGERGNKGYEGVRG